MWLITKKQLFDIQLSGRMISPLKMMHRIKHMKQHFDDPERIQLHEYLDLLLW